MSEEDATLSCERMRDAVARRRLHRFAVIAAIAVAAGVLVGAASATHETSGWITHYTGSLTSLEGRNYGPLDCNYVNWSEMSWQTGNGGRRHHLTGGPGRDGRGWLAAPLRLHLLEGELPQLDAVAGHSLWRRVQVPGDL